jgi:hypothetical protein
MTTEASFNKLKEKKEETIFVELNEEASTTSFDDALA